MTVSLSNKPLRVFVSSTSEDLTDYRAVARLAIVDMGWAPDMMEHWTTRPEPTSEACFDELSKCDLMILIVAFRRGWVPTKDQGGDGQSSITALELKYAQENNIPVLAFLANDNWPGKLWEKEQSARDWIEGFRGGLNQIVTFFEHETSSTEESPFRVKVHQALLKYKEKLLEQQALAPSIGISGQENIDGASERLRSGRCIPFLGHGIYGKGPLSICALSKALGDESCKSCDEKRESCPKSCLATAAEYLNLSLGRDLFLSRLQKIVEEQQDEARKEGMAVYDLLQKVNPPLIVSATEDLLLEEKLSSGGKRCLILCHVIRCKNENYSEKVLVFKGLEDPEPTPRFADDIDELLEEEKLEDEERACIIYKPLGSPLLHRHLKDKLGIDTVVMTEADYLILLRRLEHEKTGVPQAFSTFFQTIPPIFLGYPMDVWHYRLVGQVFQSIGFTKRSLKPFFSVRRTDSSMEKKAWEGLDVSLVSMDPNEFCQKIEATP